MINLALIGTGRWGRNYIETIEQMKGCKLIYVCSPNVNSKKYIKNKYKKIKNYKELLKKKDIDGVIIATPIDTHFNIASDFMRHSFNILVEKPLTTSFRDALELKKISKRFSGLVMVGHLYLYNPAFVKIKELIKKIGDIYYLDLEGCGYSPGEKVTSALWDWGPHNIYMTLDIINDFPIRVSAWGVSKNNNYNMVYLKLIFKNNLQVFIKTGWLSPSKKRNLTILGSKGIIAFDDLKEKKVSLFKADKVFYPKFSNQKPLSLELKEFVNAIKTGKSPKTELEQGLNTVKILHYAEESLNNNGKLVEIV